MAWGPKDSQMAKPMLAITKRTGLMDRDNIFGWMEITTKDTFQTVSGMVRDISNKIRRATSLRVNTETTKSVDMGSLNILVDKFTLEIFKMT